MSGGGGSRGVRGTMDSAPTVSVVTPLYQGMPFLDDCIESVLGQTFGDWEYVILDNASTDGSWERVREAASRDPRVRAERNEQTVPFVENWNRALELASPDARFVKVVHADDRMHPECLEAMVEIAERHPEVVLVSASVARGDEVACRWEGAPDEAIGGRRVARLSLLGEIPYVFGSPSSVLMRGETVREVVRDDGALYDEADTGLIGQVVDQDACYRLLMRGDFGYAERVLTTTREHEGSITAANERLGRWYPGKIALHLRHGPEFLDDDEHADRLDEWRERYYRFLGRQVWRGRGREFWSYHRDALDRLGPGLRPTRVAGAAAARLGERARRGLGRRAERLRRAVTGASERAGEGT